MKITNFNPDGIPVALGGWSTGITSLNSNITTTDGGLSAINFVQRITSNGSNILLNPSVNFAAGSNIALSAASNTITITGTGTAGGGSATISAGSNSTRVSGDSSAGASTTLWSPFDHRHDGIGTITSSSSNTMERGTWNIRPGTGIALSLTDTNGNGVFDTTTISTTTGGASGGSGAFSGAKAYHSTTQTITHSTVTAALFDSEEFDTDTYHSTVTNTSRMTIPSGKDGTFLLRGMCVFAQDAGGVRIARFLKNGTTILRTQYSDSGSSVAAKSAQIGATVSLVATDYVEFCVYQTTGTTLNIGNASANEEQTSFEIIRLG